MPHKVRSAPATGTAFVSPWKSICVNGRMWVFPQIDLGAHVSASKSPSLPLISSPLSCRYCIWWWDDEDVMQHSIAFVAWPPFWNDFQNYKNANLSRPAELLYSDMFTESRNSSWLVRGKESCTTKNIKKKQKNKMLPLFLDLLFMAVVILYRPSGLQLHVTWKTHEAEAVPPPKSPAHRDPG